MAWSCYYRIEGKLNTSYFGAPAEVRKMAEKEIYEKLETGGLNPKDVVVICYPR